MSIGISIGMTLGRSGRVGSASTLNNGWIASFALNEAAGATRVDSVGGNDLTESGGSGNVGSVTGIDGNAARFTAANTRRLISSAFGDLSSGFTLSFWVNPTVGGFLTFENATPGVRLTYNSDFAQDFGLGVQAAGFTTGDFHHVIFKWDGTNAYLRVDAGTASTNAPGAHDFSAPILSLGIADGVAWGTHDIDAGDIWNRALATNEEDELFALGVGKFPPW